MKKHVILLSLILCVTLLFAGCIYIDLGSNPMKGNGDKETRDIVLEGELKGIVTTSTIDVVLDPELDGKFILEGDSYILELVTVHQGGGTLELGFDPGTNLLPPTDVTAYVPYINGGRLETSSMGSITMKGGTLKGDRFELIVSSMGGINLNIETKELRADSSSMGTITLTGTADTADITLSSMGGFEGYGLAVSDARVAVSSMGSAHVNVSGTLDANVSSIGSVVYDGDPEVHASGSGHGGVKPR